MLFLEDAVELFHKLFVADDIKLLIPAGLLFHAHDQDFTAGGLALQGQQGNILLPFVFHIVEELKAYAVAVLVIEYHGVILHVFLSFVPGYFRCILPYFPRNDNSWAINVIVVPGR